MAEINEEDILEELKEYYLVYVNGCHLLNIPPT